MANQKWKVSEREVARRLQRIDGPTPNPVLRSLQTSTGRVGHLVDLQVDSFSRTFTIEVKNRKLPVWLIKAWCLVNERAKEFSLKPFLALTISSDQLEQHFVHNGKKYPIPDLYIITRERLEELLACERQLNP